MEAVGALADLEVHPAVDVDVVEEVVLVDEFLGDVAQFDADVLGSFERGLEVEVDYDKGDKLAPFFERRLLRST